MQIEAGDCWCAGQLEQLPPLLPPLVLLLLLCSLRLCCSLP